jgi:probable F420-dependent oxidoreductase
MATVVEAAREALGPCGVCLPGSLTVALNADLQRNAVRRLDHVDYRTVWVNETIGKDAFVQLGTLLAETERMVFGTCIANIWARPAQTMHAAAAQLADTYPGRLVVGIGVGYPEQAASVGQEFGRPLVTMRDYVQRMKEPTWPPVPDTTYPTIIAANGPRMLALAADIADGAFPAGQAAEFTTQARATLGPDKLLVVGLSLDPDPAVVRDNAREHLQAGADHVVILPPLGGDFGDGIDQLEQIAPALTGLG